MVAAPRSAARSIADSLTSSGEVRALEGHAQKILIVSYQGGSKLWNRAREMQGYINQGICNRWKGFSIRLPWPLHLPHSFHGESLSPALSRGFTLYFSVMVHYFFNVRVRFIRGWVYACRYPTGRSRVSFSHSQGLYTHLVRLGRYEFGLSSLPF